MNHEQLKREFLSELNSRIEKCKELESKLLQEDRNDEAVFEKIKGNVYDIFFKMFEVSYNGVYLGKNSDVKQSYQDLKARYDSFFTKIPAPWKVKREKDKNHGLTDGMIVEDVKINTAEEIKELFENYYKKFKE